MGVPEDCNTKSVSKDGAAVVGFWTARRCGCRDVTDAAKIVEDCRLLIHALMCKAVGMSLEHFTQLSHSNLEFTPIVRTCFDILKSALGFGVLRPIPLKPVISIPVHSPLHAWAWILQISTQRRY